MVQPASTRLLALTLFAALVVPGVAAAATPGSGSPPPWRLATALKFPGWLHLSATHRTRYAQLWNQFRVRSPGDDMALSLRTTLLAELRLKPLTLGLELADSRVYLVDDNTPLNTSLVNPLELLQAYVDLQLRDLVTRGAVARLRAGRITMDLGSRRLVARNRFRNTINAFTGLDLQWTGPAGEQVRGFFTLPVSRRPSSREDLADNAAEFDRERSSSVFWGLYFRAGPAWGGTRAELYLLGLHEQDTGEAPSKDRRLFTPGLRLFRQPGRGQLDFQLEAVFQAGTSRASSKAADVADLHHLAYFVHLSVGYTLDLCWQPRVVLMFDRASGDRDPDDRANNRFDTLFGARRFELGPTGIHGAFARANINMPGLRLAARPWRTVRAAATYRPVWLAQARDAWTTSGIRDSTGDAGSFVGHQLELRLRWRVLPGNVTLDTGFAHTWLGGLAAAAADPSYLYAQLGFQI